MKVSKTIRDGVIKSLPEAKLIKNVELREKLYDAWALSLATGGFRKLEDIPGSGVPDAFHMKSGTQAEHLRGVARIAAALAKEMKEVIKDFDVDIDECIAGGLCHDLGKPFEFNKENQKRWKADPAKSGLPAIRHPVYGVYVALTAGLPESIAHVAGAHSMEGDNVKRSLVAEIVHFADYAYWKVLERAGLLKDKGP